MQLAGRGRPDAPEPLDRERMEEVELAVGLDDEQPVGLRDAARHLRQELRPRHPDRDRQADALAHVVPQARRDLGGRSCEPPHPANVEERLVDRERLDERRCVVEDGEHRLARLRVRTHPRLHDDHVGTASACLAGAHRRPHARRLGLVARRQHDPAAHDHRPATEPRIVPLLDGREERVDVRVQDRGLVRHEHMFSYGRDPGRPAARMGSGRRYWPLDPAVDRDSCRVRGPGSDARRSALPPPCKRCERIQCEPCLHLRTRTTFARSSSGWCRKDGPRTRSSRPSRRPRPGRLRLPSGRPGAGRRG